MDRLPELQAPRPSRVGAPIVGCVALAVLAAAIPARGLSAQERPAARSFDLVGTVTDPNGRPLVGAFVALTGSEWGSLTGENGRFVISRVAEGDVSLTAELIGYARLEWAGTAREGTEVPLVMTPQPILLEGLTVMADRFASRRRSVPTSVRAFGRTALATSPQANVLDFLAYQGGIIPTWCRGLFSNQCLYVRGRLMEPSVWVDEAPQIGGLDYLRMIPPHELYLVEVYAHGRHIRAYTNRYMEWAAGHPVYPLPFVF